MATLEDLKENLMKFIAEKSEMLFSVWEETLDATSQETCIRQLHSQLEECFKSWGSGAGEFQQDYKVQVERKQKEVKKLMETLKINVLIPDVDHSLPLFKINSEFDKILNDLKTIFYARKETFEKLRMRELELCQELGEAPWEVVNEELPSEEDIKKCRWHVKKLKQIFSLSTNIKSMRKSIYELWEDIQETDESLMDSIRNQEGVNEATFNMLAAELKRCEALYFSKMVEIIKKLRESIKYWWNKTRLSESEQQEFKAFSSENPSKHLIKLHEEEIKKLQAYFCENQKIFELIEKGALVWQEFLAIEAKTNDPKRLNNRGGRLIKEEQNRRSILTKLNKIEESIAAEAAMYEKKEKKIFKIFGKTLTTFMAEEWPRNRRSWQVPSVDRKGNVAMRFGSVRSL